MALQNQPEKLIGPIEVESLANGGSGIVRDAGRVIFIPGAFPGDVVLCRLTKEKKKYAEGEVVRLLQPSSLRRNPPCPVADECGGCQWQQLQYSEQLKWKQRLFTDTLSRHAGIDASFVLPIVPSADEFGYRSRVQVKCYRAGKEFICGFFRSKSRFVVGIKKCPLMPASLNQLLLLLRDQLAASPFAKKIPQLDLSIGSDGKKRVVVHYLGRDTHLLADFLTALAKQQDFDLALQAGRKKNLRQLHGSGELGINVDHPDIHLNYAAGGFAQVNLKQNQELVAAVLQAAELKGNERVIDLYCGMGNFSLPLARRVKQVVGIEDYSPSIEMAKRNAAANNIGNCTFQAIPAEDALTKNGADFDLLILDPPRAGAYAVIKQLLEKPIKKIIYVSCDPQTLVRDLNPLLHSDYRLVSSQAFDMFPQTYHVESMTVLEYQGSCT